MNDDHAFERATRELLDEGSDRTPASTIEAVLLAVRTTPQERDLRIPWRTAPMSNPMRLVASIAVIVVAGVVAFNLFGSSPGVGGVSSPSPTVTPSAPAPTPNAQPSLTAINTATWTSYTSERYGFSIGHPADWTERPGDHDWTLAADADWLTTASEGFIAPASSILATAWSVSVEPGTSIDAWLQAYCPKSAQPVCTGIQDRAVVVTMDGHAGILVQFAKDTQAFILVDNRIYVVAVWEPDSDPRTASYGGAIRLLKAYLSTVHLLPGGPAPTATIPPPASSPAPS